MVKSGCSLPVIKTGIDIVQRRRLSKESFVGKFKDGIQLICTGIDGLTSRGFVFALNIVIWPRTSPLSYKGDEYREVLKQWPGITG